MSVWTWGSDVYGRLGHGAEDRHRSAPTEVVAFSHLTLNAGICGSAHNIVVDSNGQCYTWGKCHYGQLGHGEMDRNELVPRPIAALNEVRIRSVAAGDSHALAITSTGQLYTWGVGFYGALGHGDEKSLAVPKLVEGLKDQEVRSAGGGAFHSLATTSAGCLYVWGRNHCGQLGLPAADIIPSYGAGGKDAKQRARLNQKTPKRLDLPAECVQVAACNDHSLILVQGDVLLSFGSNEHGQLGREEETGSETTHPSDDPTRFQIQPSHFGGAPIRQVACGWTHCAALDSMGRLYCWGDGRAGQIGGGHNVGSRVPVQVEGFPAAAVIAQVSCGESFTVALCKDGGIWSFGGNDYGKLGVATNVPRQLLVHPAGVNKVCCGTNHVLALSLR